MGTIADVTSLVTQLIDRIKDRKAAADLREVQKMIAVLQSEQATLHQENIELRTQNQELRENNIELQKQLTSLQQVEKKPDELIDEIATEMLVLISNEGQTKSTLIERLNLNQAKGEYHFDQLIKRNYVVIKRVDMMRGGAIWGATEKGREYLASHDLLK